MTIIFEEKIFAKKIWTYIFFMAMNAIFLSPASALDTKIEEQALRCSAIYFAVSGATGSDKNNEKRFQDIALTFTRVYANEKNEKNIDMPPAEIQTRRDLFVKEMTDNYVSRQDALQEEAVLCGAWYEGFHAQGENYAYVPVIPKVIPGKVRQEYAELAAAAFKKWVSSGYALPAR